MDESLKDWLMFENDLLIGVPTYTVAFRKNVQIIVEACTVLFCDVIINESLKKYNNEFTSPAEITLPINIPSLKCASFEQVTVFSILVSQNLSGSSRLRILKELCDLLQQKIISCKSITIEKPEKPNKVSIIQSKLTTEKTNDDVTNVWWPVSCSSDSLDSSALHLIKKLVENGTLSCLLNVKIIGWKIINRGDDKARRAANSLQNSATKSSQ